MQKKIDFKAGILILTEDPENKVVLMLPKSTNSTQCRKIVTELLRLKEQSMLNGNSSDVIVLGPPDCKIFAKDTDRIIELILAIDSGMKEKRITLQKHADENWIAQLFGLISVGNKEAIELVSLLSDKKRDIGTDVLTFLHNYNLKWLISAFRPGCL